MSAAVDNMTFEDRRVFEANLARFGMTGDQHANGGLIVPEGATVALSRNTRDNGRNFVFRTKSIDQFKAWVGNRDTIFADGTEFTLPLPTAAIPVDRETAKLTKEERRNLYYAVQAYIWGPSSGVQAYKPALEMHAEMETITYVYTTLDVKGTLTFDDPSAVIVANTINYYPGGQIVGQGNITIYATNIFRYTS
jgi:hypothetical protein